MKITTSASAKYDEHSVRKQGVYMDKYYSYETISSSIRDDVRQYLKSNSIYYELSDAGGGWHFEIKASPDEARSIDNFIDTLSI